MEVLEERESDAHKVSSSFKMQKLENRRHFMIVYT